jgi:hypothetical protein
METVYLRNWIIKLLGENFPKAWLGKDIFTRIKTKHIKADLLNWASSKLKIFALQVCY